MARREELTDEQWAAIELLIPEPSCRPDGRGRPWRGSREVMNGILWILRSGARWKDLPDRLCAVTCPAIADSSSGFGMAHCDRCWKPLPPIYERVVSLILMNALLTGRLWPQKKGP